MRYSDRSFAWFVVTFRALTPFGLGTENPRVGGSIPSSDTISRRRVRFGVPRYHLSRRFAGVATNGLQWVEEATGEVSFAISSSGRIPSRAWQTSDASPGLPLPAAALGLSRRGVYTESIELLSEGQCALFGPSTSTPTFKSADTGIRSVGESPPV